MSEAQDTYNDLKKDGDRAYITTYTRSNDGMSRTAIETTNDDCYAVRIKDKRYITHESEVVRRQFMTSALFKIKTGDKFRINDIDSVVYEVEPFIINAELIFYFVVIAT